MFKDLARRAADAIYPPLCVGCAEPTDTAHGLCAACWSEITFVSGLACSKCGLPLPGEGGGASLCDICLSHPPAWDRGAASFLYQGTGRRIVLGLKHGDRLDLARPLAGWLRRAAPDLVGEADVIAPIPLHWRRLLKRTFNQSAELARHLPLTGQQQVVPDLLVRTRATESQDGKDRAARIANQAGAIAVAERYRVGLAGRAVLLVDDVMTTGASLSAAAEACRAVGASRIDVLVLARVARADLATI